ncbi:MAG: transglycosylase SLT domain-containing protein [Pseudomonadota bacterium]
MVGEQLVGLLKRPPIDRLKSGLQLALWSCLLSLPALLLAGGCASRPPADTGSICAIFTEKPRWYRAALKSQKRWGTPVHIQMAIIHQESRFEAKAAPPRRRLLGIIPTTRPSSAYGYAQVKDETWDWYRKDTGQGGADRDSFADAIDFVGWYTDVSRKRVGLSKWDPYGQYLAYHEGHGGYERRSYEAKPWLMDVAQKVDHRAREWGAQLKRCEDGLDKGGWWPFGA